MGSTVSRKFIGLLAAFALVASLVPALAMMAPAEAYAATAPTLTITKVNTGKVGIAKGKTYALGAKATSGSKIAYASSNKAVATVSSKGVVKGVKPGKATITIKAKRSGKITTKKVYVTVVKPTAYKKVAKIGLKLGASSVYVGKSTTSKVTFSPTTPSNKNVQFKSSNTAVATVNAAGKVVGKKAGTATITVYSAENTKIKKSVKVTVKNVPMKYINYTANFDVLTVGESGTITTEVVPANTTLKGVVFESSDPDVATVDASGKVTGVSRGMATITISGKDYPSVKGELTVYVRTPGLSNLSASSQYFIEGDEMTSTVTVEAGGAYGVTLKVGEATYEMNDRGNDGDAEWGDGIYSCQVNLSGLKEGESIEAVAFAKNSSDDADIQSDPLTFAAFPEYYEGWEYEAQEQSEDFAASVEEAVEDAGLIDAETGCVKTEVTVEQEDGEAIPDPEEQAANYAKCLDIAEAEAQRLVESGEAIAYDRGEHCVNVKMSSGITCMYQPEIEGRQAGGGSICIAGYQPDKHLVDATYGIEFNQLYKTSEVTLESVLNMPKNSIILWQGHGAGNIEEGQFGFVIGETTASAKSDFYNDHLYDHIWDDGGSAVLMTSFFEKYGKAGEIDLSGDIFLASACYSANTNVSMGSVLRDCCGVKAYFGFNRSVQTDYAAPFVNTMAKELLKGCTVSEAFRASAGKYGYSENEWWMMSHPVKWAYMTAIFWFFEDPLNNYPIVMYGGNETAWPDEAPSGPGEGGGDIDTPDPGEDSGEDTPALTDVSVKSKVNDYSWAELKALANAISAAASDEEGLAIAKQYHLVGADGKLTGSETKTVELSNGKTYKVRILGFYHDDKTNGGKAGITFGFTDVIGERVMNSSNTNSGGWAASQMRSWLDEEVFPMLPPELQSAIVSVEKKTNNAGSTTSTSDVTPSSDRLWLLSMNELLGSDYSVNCASNWPDGKLGGKVFAAEGSQYKLYSDAKIVKATWEEGNSDPLYGELTDGYYSYSFDLGSLNMSGNDWWLRSPCPLLDGYFLDVHWGDHVYFCDARYTRGVSPGFCL